MSKLQAKIGLLQSRIEEREHQILKCKEIDEEYVETKCKKLNEVIEGEEGQQ